MVVAPCETEPLSPYRCVPIVPMHDSPPQPPGRLATPAGRPDSDHPKYLV